MGHAPVGLFATGEYLTIIDTIQKTVTAAGTPERFTAGESASGMAIIQAFDNNQGIVVVGGPLTGDVSATSNPKKGFVLQPEGVLILPLRELKGCWIDALNNGDGVNILILG